MNKMNLEIVERLKNARIADNRHFKFPIYTGQAIMKAPIENLNLSVRANNCLKRSGVETVGDLVNSINGQDDLLKIRSLGANTAKEIMNQLFEYQYSVLDAPGKDKYIAKVVEMNKG